MSDAGSPEGSGSRETTAPIGSAEDMFYLYAWAGPQASPRSVVDVINGVETSADGKHIVSFNDSDGNPAQTEVSPDIAAYIESRYASARAQIEWERKHRLITWFWQLFREVP